MAVVEQQQALAPEMVHCAECGKDGRTSIPAFAISIAARFVPANTFMAAIFVPAIFVPPDSVAATTAKCI